MSAEATAGRPSWRVMSLWTVLYAVASAAMCAPFLPLGQLTRMADWGDARLISWTLAWHARWPIAGGWPLDAPFFAPEPAALAYSEPMIALGLLAAPVTWLAGPHVAFNLLRLAIPVANALALALLVWHYLRDARAAIVAGFALAFAYSQLASAYLGVVHLALVAGMLLTARALDRWWHGHRPTDLAVAVAVACGQALVSWYSAVIALIVIAVQLGWLAAGSSWSRPVLARRMTALAIAGIAALAILAPVARPFLGTPPPTRAEMRLFSLQPRYFVEPPTDTWPGAVVTATTAHETWDYRRSYFVGATTAAVAAIGVVAGMVSAGPAQRLLWGLPLALLGFLLSLGPSADDGWWRPFDALSIVPGVSSFRAPGRMAVLVAIGLAMLAGAGVYAAPRRRRTAVAAVLLCALAAENYMAYPPPLPSNELPVPAIFARLAADRPGAVLVLPMLRQTVRWPDEADYLQFVLPSWTPIVNGYGRRTSFTYEAVREALDVFPRQPHFVDALRFYGVTHVVVLPAYARNLTPGFDVGRFHADAVASGAFEHVAQEGDDVLYRVRSAR